MHKIYCKHLFQVFCVLLLEMEKQDKQAEINTNFPLFC